MHQIEPAGDRERSGGYQYLNTLFAMLGMRNISSTSDCRRVKPKVAAIAMKRRTVVDVERVSKLSDNSLFLPDIHARPSLP